MHSVFFKAGKEIRFSTETIPLKEGVKHQSLYLF